MSETSEHLDAALAEEFAGHGATIHRLKTSDAHFKTLMEKNHALWLEIHAIQTDVKPADDATLEGLRRKRLALLDEIGAKIAAAEA